MRYGRPSIDEALTGLRAKGLERLVVVPLYPHHASSSTGSAVDEVSRVLSSWWTVPATCVLPAFHGEQGFIAAWAAQLEPMIATEPVDHVLFSFHGLPERHVRKAALEAGMQCRLDASCCNRLDAGNRDCYRAQCHETARRVAAALGLDSGLWSLAFQSRLGRTPWMEPHADQSLARLPSQGIRRLLVACPGFVADCLETLEELGIRGRATFMEAGGERFRLAPCLNVAPRWTATLADLVRAHADLRPEAVAMARTRG
jgi:ferrochelatase